MSRSASPTRTATPSTAGARTSWSTAPGRFPPTAPCSRATSITPTSTPARPRFTSSAPAHARHRVPEQPPFSRGFPGQPARPQRDRLPGNSPLQDRMTRGPASPAPSSSRFSRPETRISGPPTSRSGRTGRSTSSTGRTRSSATCSTTCATPAATGSTAGSTGSPTRGRPLSKPARIAGALDRGTARSAQGPRGPRRATGPGSSWARRRRPGHRRRSRPGSAARQGRPRI